MSKASSLSGDAGRTPSECSGFRHTTSYASLENSRAVQEREALLTQSKETGSIPLPASAMAGNGYGMQSAQNEKSMDHREPQGGAARDGRQPSADGGAHPPNEKGWFRMMTNMWGGPAKKIQVTMGGGRECVCVRFGMDSDS